MADKMQELMTRLPSKDFAVALSEQTLEEFRERGFTAIPQVTTDEEIMWLREVYDLFFSDELNLPKGALVRDVNSPLANQRDRAAAQILFPESLYPQLRQTVFYRNTQRIAQQLLGDGDLSCWGHMIRKPPHSAGHVPWHQDEAYWDPHFDHQAAAFWMPLEDATPERGAMSFIPGSHKAPLMQHGFPKDDPSVTAIMIKEDMSLEGAVPHPVPAGGVSMHHHRVLHSSGPNVTNQARRAYINVWNSKAVQRLTPHDRAWYWQKKEARDRFHNETQYFHDDSFLDITRKNGTGS